MNLRRRSIVLRIFRFLCCAAFVATGIDAQQPSFENGRSAANSLASEATEPAASSPTGALREALSAACAENQKDFARFLTVRNAQTFSQLTPTARTSLMKRFVLLSEPGKPSIANSSGHPTVRCETSAGTAEIQIGTAEANDNLAFLPVEVRSATDTTGNNAAHVKIGLVRESGEWKLLSVGLVLLDLPALAAEWDAAEIGATESAALEATKAIGEAIETYRRTYSHLPESLSKLGPPRARAAASPEAAGLLDAELASGKRSGYVFRYVIVGANTLGAPAKYELAATPQTYGRTGRRSFFRDPDGGLHAADHQGAVGSAADPKVP